MTIIYRSKRRGFIYYVIGQMKAIAKRNYNIRLKIDVADQTVAFDALSVKFKYGFLLKKDLLDAALTRTIRRLQFDNSSYNSLVEKRVKQEESSLPFKANILFEVFPFAILISNDLKLLVVGKSLRQILPSYVIGDGTAMVGIKYQPYINLLCFKESLSACSSCDH